jgi:CheY-like chemotaxis protein
VIKLLVADSESHAVTIKSLLESEGIKVVIVTSNVSYAPGILGVYNGFVPYDVFIPEADLEKAKELLKA